MEEVKNRPSGERVLYGPNVTPQGYASNPPK